MPAVNVPGVGRLNFPEGMSEADMASAIERNYGPQLQAQRAPEDVTAGMGLRGIPVGGAYVPQAEAAIRAAAHPLSGVGEPGASYGERYAKNLALRQAQYARAEKDRPILSEALKFGGGMAALGPVGATATGARLLGISGPMLARLGLGATSGAGISAADALARGEDVGTAAAIGAGGALVGRALEGLPQAIARAGRGGAERAADVATLGREGVELSAGRATGYKPLQTLEERFGDITGAGTRLAERGKEQFTAAAARRAGINADRLRPEVMNQALENFNQQYGDMASRNVVQGNANLRQLGQDMTTALADYTRMTGTQGPPAPREYMGRIIDAIADNNGTIPGDIYHALRSDIGRDARRAVHASRQGAAGVGQENFYLSDALHELQGALDNAMTRSMAASGSPDMAAWRQLNREYRNFLPIERAITSPGEEARWGLLSPMALRAALIAQQGRRNFGRGAGDLAPLAAAGESVMKPIPTSGTPQAAYLMSLPASMGSAAWGLGTGNLGLLGAGLAGMAGPPAAGAALMSRPVQRYLSGAPTSLPLWASTLGITGAQQYAPQSQ